MDAMRELPASVLEPIRAMLAGDPIAAAPDPAAAAARDRTASAAAIWRDAIEGRLPPSPDLLKKAVATLGSAARLLDLQHVIDVIRLHETREADQMRRRGKVLGPLHGIPVLLKGNIDTGDRMQTTAGSLGLAGAPVSTGTPVQSTWNTFATISNRRSSSRSFVPIS